MKPSWRVWPNLEGDCATWHTERTLFGLLDEPDTLNTLPLLSPETLDEPKCWPTHNSDANMSLSCLHTRSASETTTKTTTTSKTRFSQVSAVRSDHESITGANWNSRPVPDSLKWLKSESRLYVQSACATPRNELKVARASRLRDFGLRFCY